MSAEGRVSNKQSRVAEYLKKSPKVPVLDATSREKQELCFEYVRRFLRIFSDKYPNRRPPYLLATNEFSELKLVCSTVRPTQLPFGELYSLHACASFLANFLVYEPLPSPSTCPSLLCSPAMTLATHRGDAFDSAALLCSLLLGNGYDAYVVIGTAPKRIAHCDQTNIECPVLPSPASDAISISGNALANMSAESNNSSVSEKENEELPPLVPSSPPAPQPAASLRSQSTEEGVGEKEGSAYQLIDNSVKGSAFLEMEKERQRVLNLDRFVLWKEKEEDCNASSSGSSSPPSAPHVHAWVLVKAGKRDVLEHVFLEPTTGRATSTSSSPYLSIESVFNHVNAWIPHTSVYEARLSDINFDFVNPSLWYTLFLPSKPIRMNGEEVDDEEEEESNDPASEQQLSFDCPASWVPAFDLPRVAYLLRYPPSGQRSTFYKRAKLDRFAKYTHSQGLVMRLTKYLDADRVICKEIHEWFEGRKDKLYRRVRTMLGAYRFEEYFHPGSNGEVKRWVEIPGKRIEVDFYVDGRLDRLKRREEEFTVSVNEIFEGRVDLLQSQRTEVTTESAGDCEKLNNSVIASIICLWYR